MPSSNISALSDETLLAKEEKLHKYIYRLFIRAASYFLWVLFRIVLTSIHMRSMDLHIFFAAIGGISYYVGALSRIDLCLVKLRKEIVARQGLEPRKLTLRDYVEVVGNGLSIGLGICATVEVLDIALGTHHRGAR